VALPTKEIKNGEREYATFNTNPFQRERKNVNYIYMHSRAFIISEKNAHAVFNRTLHIS